MGLKRTGPGDAKGNAIMGMDRLVKAILVLMGLAAIWWFRAPLGDLLAVVGDRAAVVAYLERFGVVGPIFLVIILVVQVIVALIPGHILMISGGYVYGFGMAFALNLAATVGGSQIAFFIAKWAGRPVVERLAPADLLAKWNRLSAEKGLIFFMLSFMLPIFPADVMNFVAGLSPLSGRHFFVANLLGRIPGVILFSAIGAYGFQLSAREWIVVLAVAVPVTLTIWTFGLKRLPALREIDVISEEEK